MVAKGREVSPLSRCKALKSSLVMTVRSVKRDAAVDQHGRAVPQGPQFSPCTA
jgi:hypothetical protein